MSATRDSSVRWPEPLPSGADLNCRNCSKSFSLFHYALWSITVDYDCCRVLRTFNESMQGHGGKAPHILHPSIRCKWWASRSGRAHRLQKQTAPGENRIEWPSCMFRLLHFPHSPPYSAEVNECVELYLHAPIHLHGVVLS